MRREFPRILIEAISYLTIFSSHLLTHTVPGAAQGGALSISKALSHLPLVLTHTLFTEITVDKPEGVSNSWAFSHVIFTHIEEDY